MTRNAAPPAEHVSWERLRDAYVARFGPLLHAEAEYFAGVTPDPDEPRGPEVGAARKAALAAEDLRWLTATDEELGDHPIYWGLVFGPMTEDEPRIVRATFGATPLVEHEIFIATTVPFGPLSGVIDELLREHGPLSPGMVARLDLRPGPFNAVLLAPPGAGSIPLGEVGGVERFALNVIPLTPAETELAADSVDRLVAALRNHGVLEATDPMRDCVLLPERTRRYWAHMRPEVIALTQRRLQQRSARLERQTRGGAPEWLRENERRLVKEAVLFLRYIESRSVDPGSPAERSAAVLRKREASFEQVKAHVEGLFTTGALPSPLRALCAHLLGLTLATHPVADQLLLDAEGHALKARFDAERLLPRLVKVIRASWPDADPAALLAGGRRGWSTAAGGAAADDGFVAPHVVWERILTAMFAELEDPTGQRQAMGKALRAGVEGVNPTLMRESDLGPMERLKDMAMVMVLRMVKAWCEALGIEMPWKRLRVSAPPELQEPRKAPKAKGASKKYH